MSTTAHDSSRAPAAPDAIATLIDGIARRARVAAGALAVASTRRKNAALVGMAAIFRARAAEIVAENEKDLAAGRKAGLSAAMLDRLALDAKRVEAMAASLEKVAMLDDPIGEVVDAKRLPNGIELGRMRVPIGVIGIIFESRPNVTADAGCLCLKSGNAVILRGGSEAFHSNMVLGRLMDEAIQQAGLPAGCVQLVPTTDRAAVGALLQRNDLVDLIIPRGGKSLIERVVADSRIPVIKHYDGNCFIYIDETADPLMAATIMVNAKTQRPGVCNAVESLLMHRDWAARHGADLIAALQEKKVEIRADEALRALVPGLAAATPEDWETEYLDLILTAGIVDSTQQAIDFINAHSSHHTDAIVTRDYAASQRFLAGVDSACVFVNCSTRLSDGGQFGMGCEIGISTDKLHARGPMGLRELTTLKFIARGDGQARE
jgi:glutamate-5-semialdehyde dehydrogenase